MIGTEQSPATGESNEYIGINFFNKFDEHDEVFQKIHQDMNPWQNFLRNIIKIFNKNKLREFYLKCGLKRIEKDLHETLPNWYIAHSKALGPKFAETLYEFTRALAIIAPILKATVINSNIKTCTISIEPCLLEIVFYALYGEDSVKNYPFSAEQMEHFLKTASIGGTDRKIEIKIQNFLENFSESDFESIDYYYTNFIYLSRILSVPLMDFLRRFNIHASLQQENNNWSPVTLSAISHYLEKLYVAIMLVDLHKIDFFRLDQLQNAQFLIEKGSEEHPIDHAILEKAWNTIIDTIETFKINNNLLKLIQLAHKDPGYRISYQKARFNIHERYIKILKERVFGIVKRTARNSLKQEMQNLVQNVISIGTNSQDLTNVGIFTVSNSDKIHEIISEGFTHVYTITLMQIFIVKFYKPWLKVLLGSCTVNAQFTQPAVSIELNSVYKVLNKITDQFNQFVIDVHPTSSMGIRITKLLEAHKHSRSDKHLLKVFTESLNKQADTLVREFTGIFSPLQNFISLLLKDIQQNSKSFITNINTLKVLQEPETARKLQELNNFNTNVMELLNISTQEQA